MTPRASGISSPSPSRRNRESSSMLPRPTSNWEPSPRSSAILTPPASGTSRPSPSGSSRATCTAQPGAIGQLGILAGLEGQMESCAKHLTQCIKVFLQANDQDSAAASRETFALPTQRIRRRQAEDESHLGRSRSRPLPNSGRVLTTTSPIRPSSDQCLKNPCQVPSSQDYSLTKVWGVRDDGLQAVFYSKKSAQRKEPNDNLPWHGRSGWNRYSRRCGRKRCLHKEVTAEDTNVDHYEQRWHSYSGEGCVDYRSR